MRTQQLLVRLSEAEQAELRRRWRPPPAWRCRSTSAAASWGRRSRLRSPAPWPPGQKRRLGGRGRALLQVRVRPDQGGDLGAKAGRAGLSLSAYVRRAALELDVVHRFDQAAKSTSCNGSAGNLNPGGQGDAPGPFQRSRAGVPGGGVWWRWKSSWGRSRRGNRWAFSRRVGGAGNEVATSGKSGYRRTRFKIDFSPGACYKWIYYILTGKRRPIMTKVLVSMPARDGRFRFVTFGKCMPGI